MVKRHEFEQVAPGRSRCRLCRLEARVFDDGPSASPRYRVRYGFTSRGGKPRGGEWSLKMIECK